MEDHELIQDRHIWSSYVGRAEERQLLDQSRRTSPRAAVRDYIAHLDETFEPGTRDDIPEGLEDVLVRCIERKRGGR